MKQSSDVLKIRVLNSFLNRNQEECTVTKIARTLGVEKYTITRILIDLEKEGLVNRDNPRSPYLTEKGQKYAEKYAERIRVCLNHLMYEGVNTSSAQTDAYHISLHVSEGTMDIFREADERYRIKYAFSDKKKFSGTDLCRKMKDGVYQFPFFIYREHTEAGNHISWANEAFEQPCTFTVKDGMGTIQLRIKDMVARHPNEGMMVKGRAKRLKYLEYGDYVMGENNGSVISFPVDALLFISVGSGVGQILHGSANLKLSSIVDGVEMPEYPAIFTLII